MGKQYDYFTVAVVGVGEDAVLVAKGEIDFHAAPRLWKAIDDHLTGGHNPLVIDMADVHFIDSGGIAVLARASEALGSRPDALVLRSPSDVVMRMLQIAGITDLITLQPRPS